jgi:amidase
MSGCQSCGGLGSRHRANARPLGYRSTAPWRHSRTPLAVHGRPHKFLSAYVSLLRPAQTREDYDANALGLPEKGPPSTAHQWLAGLDVQQRMRQCWATLFQEWDIVLAPCFGTVAFHHLPGPWKDTTLDINGQAAPYGRQVAWPAIASFGCLPATAFPADFTADGLPIGLQAIGPFLEDRTTLAFVRLLEKEQLCTTPLLIGA